MLEDATLVAVQVIAAWMIAQKIYKHQSIETTNRDALDFYYQFHSYKGVKLNNELKEKYFTNYFYTLTGAHVDYKTVKIIAYSEDYINNLRNCQRNPKTLLKMSQIGDNLQNTTKLKVEFTLLIIITITLIMATLYTSYKINSSDEIRKILGQDIYLTVNILLIFVSPLISFLATKKIKKIAFKIKFQLLRGLHEIINKDRQHIHEGIRLYLQQK